MPFKFRFVNAAIMSLLLTFLMTLWITWINLGFVDDFLIKWVKAWFLAWPAAFVCVLILAQPVQKLTQKLLSN